MNRGLTAETQEEVLSLLGDIAFRPEFLNRIDDTVIIFNLWAEDKINIVKIMVQQLQERSETSEDSAYPSLASPARLSAGVCARPSKEALCAERLWLVIWSKIRETEMTVQVSLKDRQLEFNYLV